MTIELIDEAVAKKRKKIPQNYIPFRNEEFNLELYYPDDWIPNTNVPVALITLFAPNKILKGKFNSNLTISARYLSRVKQDIKEITKFNPDTLKRLLTSQGVQKFKMKEVKSVKVAESPARRLIYAGKIKAPSMKFDLVWTNCTALINSIEYTFTLTTEKKDHKTLLKIFEQIIETVSLIE